MNDEDVVVHFTIVRTADGFIVEQEESEGYIEIISAPDGQDVFRTYLEACVVLAEHLLRGLNEQHRKAS